MRLLIGLCLFGLSSALRLHEFFEFNHQLSDSTHPCDDFHDFVCNQTGSLVEKLDFQLRSVLETALINDNDRIVDEFKLIFDQMEKIERLRQVGHQDYGNGQILISRENSDTLTVTYDEHSLLRKKYETSNYSATHPLIQGAVDAYLEVHKDLNKDELAIKNYYDQDEADMLDYQLTMEMTRPQNQTLLDFRVFKNYLKLLYLKYILEKQLYPVGEDFRLYEVIFGQIQKEILTALKSASWVSESTQKAISDRLSRVELRIYQIPESLQDLKQVKDVISKIQDYFFAFKQTHNYSSNCDGNCMLNHYGDLVNLAYNRYTLEEGDDVLEFDFLLGNELVTYDNVSNMLTLNPRKIHWPDQNLPFGVKYGLIGPYIAGALVHSVIKPEIMAFPEFVESEKCLEEHVGKAFEVTAVESVRIAVKAIANQRKFMVTKREMMSYSTYSDIEWFFVGLQLPYCSLPGGYNDQWQLIPEFAATFECKKDGKTCELF